MFINFNNYLLYFFLLRVKAAPAKHTILNNDNATIPPHPFFAGSCVATLLINVLAEVKIVSMAVLDVAFEIFVLISLTLFEINFQFSSL